MSLVCTALLFWFAARYRAHVSRSLQLISHTKRSSTYYSCSRTRMFQVLAGCNRISRDSCIHTAAAWMRLLCRSPTHACTCSSCTVCVYARLVGAKPLATLAEERRVREAAAKVNLSTVFKIKPPICSPVSGQRLRFAMPYACKL